MGGPSISYIWHTGYDIWNIDFFPARDSGTTAVRHGGGNASLGQVTTLILGTRVCCDVESTSMTLIQRRNNVVCPEGWFSRGADGAALEKLFLLRMCCSALQNQKAESSY